MEVAGRVTIGLHGGRHADAGHIAEEVVADGDLTRDNPFRPGGAAIAHDHPEALGVLEGVRRDQAPTGLDEQAATAVLAEVVMHDLEVACRQRDGEDRVGRRVVAHRAQRGRQAAAGLLAVGRRHRRRGDLDLPLDVVAGDIHDLQPIAGAQIQAPGEDDLGITHSRHVPLPKAIAVEVDAVVALAHEVAVLHRQSGPRPMHKEGIGVGRQPAA